MLLFILWMTSPNCNSSDLASENTWLLFNGLALQPLRFNLKMDLVLLNEVIAHNPYKELDDKSAWIDIACAMTEAFNDETKICSDRRARERTRLVLDKHKGDDAESLRKYDWFCFRLFLFLVACVSGFVKCRFCMTYPKLSVVKDCCS